MKKWNQEVSQFADDDDLDDDYDDDLDDDPECSEEDWDDSERVNILYTLPPIMEQIAFVRKYLPSASVTECRDAYATYHSYKEEGQSRIVALQYAGLT